MSTLFFIIILVGFARSFYLRTYFEFPELPVHLSLPGAALTAWFALAFIQPWLIKSHHTKLHRKLGIAGGFLAIGVVITGLWTLVLRDGATIDELPNRAAGNLGTLIMFLTCMTLGVLFRHKPATHKRLMLFSSISIIAPAIDRLARIPAFSEFLGRILSWVPAQPEVAFAALSFLFLLLSVVVNDLVSQRKVLSGTFMGLFAILIFAPAATYMFIVSGAWVALVHRFV